MLLQRYCRLNCKSKWLGPGSLCDLWPSEIVSLYLLQLSAVTNVCKNLGNMMAQERRFSVNFGDIWGYFPGKWWGNSTHFVTLKKRLEICIDTQMATLRVRPIGRFSRPRQGLVARRPCAPISAHSREKRESPQPSLWKRVVTAWKWIVFGAEDSGGLSGWQSPPLREADSESPKSVAWRD